MDFIQIGSINYDDIEDPAKRKWLESVDSSMNPLFVEVLDGDASLVRDFDNENVLTFDDLMASSYAQECYVAVDKDLADESEIAAMDNSRARAESLPFGLLYFEPAE